MSDPAVLRDVRDGVVWWTLNLPMARNPFSYETKECLIEYAQDFLDDKNQKVAVITGGGDFFSAGGDLRALGQEPTALSTHTMIARTHKFLRLLQYAEKPVITAVNGGAVGAGVGLAMAGDVILASDRAWFMSGFPRIGAVPDVALLYQLVRTIGRPKAADFLLANRRIDAAEAHQDGMVSRVVPHDKILEAADTLAREFADGPTVSVGLTRAMLAMTWDDTYDGHLLREDLAQATAFSTQDFREGINALREGRKARFKGI